MGFRPSVCRLASTLELGGFVRNDAGDVHIEVEGDPDGVRRFADELAGSAPPLARIDFLTTASVPPCGDDAFVIEASREDATGAGAAIPSDVAPCADCLRELHDPEDRRFRYPFVNCTSCGPRFTIVRDVPYDRARTTMDGFPLCVDCRREYEDPRDRRFHAEPNACPACGPKVTWVEDGVGDLRGREGLDAAVRALAGGRIVAVKGVGGFVLAVDATEAAGVARLRERKRRPHKPFAVMVRDLAHAERIAELDDAARAALVSPARPVVLMPARRGSPLAAGIAPGLSDVGVFLPPTPLQHLLLAEGPPYQVMTSGNVAEEPIARENGEARGKLAGIAEGFLFHDRPIHTRADDSVVRAAGAGRGGVVPIRRARGFVPEAIPMPVDGPPVLAVGAEWKSTVCVSRGGQAVVSQHVGDLDHPDAVAFFEETIEKLVRLLGVRPEAVAHDLHPDFRSTRWALASGLPAFPVQHHHAHVAACMTEHGRAERVLAVAFDGTGYGPDGTLWGGELLLADLRGFHRLAHLRPLPLAGGEAAIREPWRIALACLQDAGEEDDLLHRVDERRRRAVGRLLQAGLATVTATGAGRWFDAVAALCGLGQGNSDAISYEGQAAAELEALAAGQPAEVEPYAHSLGNGRALEIDLRPAIRGIARDLRAGASPALVSARFHETLARAAADACVIARDGGAPAVVALTGGCFQNRRLLARATDLLEARRFEVLSHRKVPPNDGGLSLGQAAVATARLAAAAAGDG